MPIKNSNDTIGSRTRDFPACSAVPQPTAPPAACPNVLKNMNIIWTKKIKLCNKRLFVGNKTEITQHFMKMIGTRRGARKDLRQIGGGGGLTAKAILGWSCKGYPRVKLILSAQACTHDTKAKSDSSRTWRCSDGMIQQKIWKKLGATNTEFLRVLRMPEWPLAGQIVQAILAWSYRLGRTANPLQFFFSHFGIKTDVISLFKIYIYIYILHLLYRYVNFVI